MDLTTTLSQYLPQLSRDLNLFLPEVVVCGTMVAMLLLRAFLPGSLQVRPVALIGIVIACFIATGQFSAGTTPGNPGAREIFDGLLVVDSLTNYIRVFIYSFTFLVIVLGMITRVPDNEDSADFFTLLLGSALGMVMMAQANHLMMIFLAVEMASVPSYALAGYFKGRKPSSEAALKYVVYGGAAAGIMLYGLTLLAGGFGTMHLPTLAINVRTFLTNNRGLDMYLLLALSTFLIGLAFKLSAVPFHFWCPDVFEGAPAEVGAFLSVASKGAAVALLARVSLALTGQYLLAPETLKDWQPAADGIAKYLGPSLALLATLSCTFGNFAAIGQTNVKRMLAYSTIAHAGYMLLALSTLSIEGLQATLFYLAMYFYMNLGAFAVVAFVRRWTGSEDLEAFNGLIHKAPTLAVAMTIFLASLVGMPPLAGFIAKFNIFAVLYSKGALVLLVIGGINTVISLYYYVNLIRVMIIGNTPKPTMRETLPQRGFAVLLAAPLIVFGIMVNMPMLWASFGAKSPSFRLNDSKVSSTEKTGSAVANQTTSPSTPRSN